MSKGARKRAARQGMTPAAKAQLRERIRTVAVARAERVATAAGIRKAAITEANAVYDREHREAWAEYDRRVFAITDGIRDHPPATRSTALDAVAR